MVNRDTNFNRRYIKKIKQVRDIRKSKTGALRKGKVAVKAVPEGHDKKMSTRQEKFNKICASMNVKKGDIFKRRPMPKKDKLAKQAKKDAEVKKMETD